MKTDFSPKCSLYTSAFAQTGQRFLEKSLPVGAEYKCFLTMVRALSPTDTTFEYHTNTKIFDEKSKEKTAGFSAHDSLHMHKKGQTLVALDAFFLDFLKTVLNDHKIESIDFEFAFIFKRKNDIIIAEGYMTDNQNKTLDFTIHEPLDTLFPFMFSEIKRQMSKTESI
jgi:hypothetical protein